MRTLNKFVGRDLQVEGRRALANPAGRVVVRAMARAEPTVVVSRAIQRDAPEVRADSNKNQPDGVKKGGEDIE